MPAAQSLYEVFPHQKADLLTHLLLEFSPEKNGIIFLRTKDGVHALKNQLISAGLPVDAVTGTTKPVLRDRALADLTAGRIRFLVATEAILRQSDLSQFPLIIQFEFPEVAADYLARLESAEEIITFATREDGNQVRKLEALINQLLPPTRSETFAYDSQPKNAPSSRNSAGTNKTQSKPLQHKKPKLKNKGPRRKTGRTRKR